MSQAPQTATSRSYGGKSKEERRAQRRDKMLEAAKVVFGEHGFHAATVKQLCNEAGLTERYFYESFSNQSELFAAIYDRELDALREALIAALSTAPREVEAMAEAALQAYFGRLKADPHAARILLIEVYGTTQDMDRLYRRGVSDFAELIRGIIEQQFRLSENSPLSPGLLSTGLVGAAIHLAMRWYLGGYKESVDIMVSNTLTFITSVNEKLASA